MVAAYFAITLLVVSAMFGWIIVRLRSRHGLTD
jgi:hypothetical protein